VLATSRQALGLLGEHAWPVPPLVPPPEGADLATVAASEAVRLFVERAQAVRPNFHLTTANAADVGEICRRLDGLPLALELAAARVRVLALDEILSRLGDRFALLTTPGRGVPARQRSLLAAVQWSYELLPEDERRLFRRLSVCVGGFDLAVTEALDAPAPATLDRVSRLVDKSLLVQEERGDGSMRSALLVTLRAFGHQRLVEAGEETDARDRHLDHFLSATASVAEELWGGAGQNRAFAALESDRDNLRAALAWGLERRGAEALRLAVDLVPFWRCCMHHSEGRQWLNAALAHAPADASARGRALAGSAILAYDQGDSRAAAALATDAVDLCRRSGDTIGLGLALHRLAVNPEVDDEGGDALQLEALSLFEAAHFGWGIGTALSSLGNNAGARGDLARAEELLARSLEVHQSLGDDLGTSAVLYFLGGWADARGDTARARALHQACIETARPSALRASAAVMFALVRLADMASSDGHDGDARTMLHQAVADVRDSGFHLADLVHWYGVVEVRQGNADRGVRMVAAAAGHRGSFGSPSTGASFMIGWMERHEASLTETRAALPPDRFAQAWAEGEQMGLERAADLILEAPRPPGST
jgi:predicted ATPase